jgi:hypothetical protein
VELFMHVVRSLDSSPLSIIWIVLLIDCFVNTDLKGPQKLWWVLFILLTQFFGALLYFFLGPAQIYRHIVNKMNEQSQSSDNNQNMQPLRQEWYKQTLHSIYPQPHSSPIRQQYHTGKSDAYGQGYRAQERVTPLSTREADSTDSFYEEPQATYPEMTQEQK